MFSATAGECPESRHRSCLLTIGVPRSSHRTGRERAEPLAAPVLVVRWQLVRLRRHLAHLDKCGAELE
jgi:hypothetical protein